MSILCLRNALDSMAPDRPVWLVPEEGDIITAGEVAQRLCAADSFVQRVRGKRVAVWADAECDLAPLLVTLDGVCRSITLLPSTLSAERTSVLLKQSQSEILIGTNEVPQVSAGIESFTYRWRDVKPASTSNPPGSFAPQDTRWLLATSGTTGDPKLIAHSLASLTRTTKLDSGKGGEFRWGSLYNLTGFAGLQVFFQSWFGGASLILGTRFANFSDRVSMLEAARCNALSATPTMYRKMLLSGALEQLDLQQITIGGEIVDQGILDALRAQFPHARIVHIYASTEAGVGFSVRDCQEGFPAAYLKSPQRGVHMAVDERNHLWLGRRGTVQDGEPSGMIDTGDLVEKRGDRYVFRGRANGTINVGGNKVHPEEVEHFLLALPEVHFARVRPRKSSLTGSLVQADVVPAGHNTLSERDFKAYLLSACRSELEPHKVPAIMRVVSSLEYTSSGKLQRTS